MQPQSVVVTGASRGIGAALAERAAAPGVRILLIGRDEERLEQVAERVAARGAQPRVAVADVTDAAGIEAHIAAADAARPIDLLFANAGVSAGQTAGGALESTAAAARVVRTNLEGVVNSVAPVAERMLARRQGRIGLISSLAGLLPLPDSPSYCASKSGVVAYGRSLDLALRPSGVSVTVLCPGFVKSDMSDRFLGAKPFLMEADRAAELMFAAVMKRRRVYAFPWQLAALVRGAGLLHPAVLAAALTPFRFKVGEER